GDRGGRAAGPRRPGERGERRPRVVRGRDDAGGAAIHPTARIPRRGRPAGAAQRGPRPHRALAQAAGLAAHAGKAPGPVREAAPPARGSAAARASRSLTIPWFSESTSALHTG